MSERGFTDIAVDSARAFRTIMTAMSRPARILALDCGIEAPAPLAPAAHAVALTLCDFQTPVYLAPALRSPAVDRYLRFHTGAPRVELPQDAAFAFIAVNDAAAALMALAVGSHEYPDRSATVVIQSASLTESGPAEFTGPGIQGIRSFGVEGMGSETWQLLAENHARFPLGFDVIFVSAHSIVALPRSTAIAVREMA